MLKLSRFTLPLGANRVWTRMTDVLSPPDDVRGMMILDRCKFRKKIRVPCIQCSIDVVKESSMILKSYMLKLINFKPVQIVDDRNRVFILDPRKILDYDSFDEGVRGKLEERGITGENMRFQDLELTYDNWKSDEILRSVIPEDKESVSSYSQIGHILHINLNPSLSEYKQIIGQVLLDKVANSRTVVSKIDSINNEFRNFEMEVLAGDKDLRAKVKENKCTFELDFSQVYWNPRLSTEHLMVVEYLKKGDVLFDVFAGVGPFSIPSAKKGVQVFANDLNQHSIKWLRNNAQTNKIKDKLVSTNKDGSLFIKEDFKTNFLKLEKGDYKILVTMNLPALAPEFLSNFVGLFSEEDRERVATLPCPEIFVYCFTKNEVDPAKAAREMIINKIGMEQVVGEPHFVRNVAPNKNMYRVKLQLTPHILINKKRLMSHPSESNNKCIKL